MSVSIPIARTKHNVLVTEAQTIGSIAVIRSLARAGFIVHACSGTPNALGFRSNYATSTAVCPAYDDPRFLNWLHEYIATHKIECIVPSEGFLLAIKDQFCQLRSLLPLSSSAEVVYSGMSKFDLFERLANCTWSGPCTLPPMLLVDLDGPIPSLAELEELGSPLFIKLDGIYSRRGLSGRTLSAGNAREAFDLLGQLASDYDRAVVQGFVPGRGVGAFLLRWKGEVLAEFMHERIHEVPWTGGVSSFRRSWWYEPIIEDARTLVNHLDWEGVAMIEFRYDPERERAYLMEMNGRFWGSLHLALFAGVDFPSILLDAFLRDQRPPNVVRGKLGVACRLTFPKEVQYVWSRIKSSLPAGLAASAEFAWLTLNPRIRSDLLFPGDTGLYWAQLWKFIRTGT